MPWAKASLMESCKGVQQATNSVAPLWGLGQRTYFLHDGRTSDLLVTIQAHASQFSAANVVIQKFNNLASSVKQDILNFLRAL